MVKPSLMQMTIGLLFVLWVTAIPANSQSPGPYVPFQVRLVNLNRTSNNSGEGRLEIFYNGVWGTVCDDGFNDVNARIVCYQLGFGYVGRFKSNEYGPGEGQIWLDDIYCNGYETRIADCPHSAWGYNNCGHSEDVSISCLHSEATTSAGANPRYPVRLANSSSMDNYSSSVEGRVEIFYNDTWGTVCDDGFNDAAARVICCQLGFGSVGRFMNNQFGAGDGPIWLDDVYCDGFEQSVADCRHSDWGRHNCAHSEDVSISCLTTNSSSQNATVTVKFTTYPINFTTAKVNSTTPAPWNITTKGANLTTAFRSNFTTARVNGTTTTPWIVTTTGVNVATTYRSNYKITTVNSITAVYFSNGTTTIRSNGSSPAHGDLTTKGVNATTTYGSNFTTTRITQKYPVRLVNRYSTSSNPKAGRLEIFYNGVWGTVCDDLFHDINARVACFSLGFGRQGRVIGNMYGPGNSTMSILLDDVSCKGTESSIADCSHLPWYNTNCVHAEDVSVDCSPPTTTTTTTPAPQQYAVRLVNSISPTNIREGRLEMFYNGFWGTICNNPFPEYSAHVACFSLGFGRKGRVVQNIYGPGSGPIWLSDVICVGDEANLQSCRNPGFGVSFCAHSEDVSISCT